jgi:small GTP-binding protein
MYNIDLYTLLKMFSPRNKIKLSILGDSYTGKTSIISKYYNCNYKNDTRVDYYTKLVNDIKVDTWDVKGDIAYNKITNTYIQDANAFIILFDITNKSSFNNISSWIDRIRENSNIYGYKYYPMLLLGNKSDLTTERRVLFSEANKYARDNKLLYLEVSMHDKDRLMSCIDTYIENVYNFIYNDSNDDIANIQFMNSQFINKGMITSKSIENITLDNEKYTKKQRCYNCLTCYML